MTWNFDISAAPRDGSEIWVEIAKDNQVMRTRYVKTSTEIKVPYWLGIGDESRILAWQPSERPVPSFVGRGTSVAGEVAIIEDCGSGA